VLLALEARARGFACKHPELAFRRWCRRVGVPIHKTGRLEWVCPTAVDRAVGGCVDATAQPSNDTAVLAIVAALKGRR
jgi:hypothetical protein